MQAAPKAAPQFAYGLPGNLGPAGDFDPAKFLEGKSELEVFRYREAELTHGRVSMLASLGFLVQEKFHPLFSGDGGPAIDQIPQLPIWLWGAMLAGIGSGRAVPHCQGLGQARPEDEQGRVGAARGLHAGRPRLRPVGACTTASGGRSARWSSPRSRMAGWR